MKRHKPWQERWFATHASAKLFVKSIFDTSWGVELFKVNSANKRYHGGFYVRWYER